MKSVAWDFYLSFALRSYWQSDCFGGSQTSSAVHFFMPLIDYINYMPQRLLLVTSGSQKEISFPLLHHSAEGRMKWKQSEELKHQRCSWSWRQHVLLLKMLICFVDMFLSGRVKLNDNKLYLSIINWALPSPAYVNSFQISSLYTNAIKFWCHSSLCQTILQETEPTLAVRQGLPIPGGSHGGTPQECPQWRWQQGWAKCSPLESQRE